MNYELFLAKRFTASKRYKSSVSSPIIKIAIAAIAIGIVMMLVSVATGIGLQHKIRDKVAVFKGHIQITSFDNNNSETTQNPIVNSKEFHQSLGKIQGIKHVQSYACKAGIIRTEKDFEGVVFKGVGTGYDWTSIEEYLIAGKLPKINPDQISSEVFISETISNRLNLHVGDKFDTYFIKENPNSIPNRRILTVSGVYNSGFEDFDKSFILGDLKQVQKLNKWKSGEVGGFEIILDDFEQLQQKGELIYEEIASDLNSRTIFELFPSIFEWLRLFDTNISIIIGIMILVAGINMITALLVLILERTQTIGILKALGSSNWGIRKIFLYNASYLILRGLFWGNTIGLSLLLLQSYFGIVTLDPTIYYVSEAPVYISLWHVVLLNIGTLVLCLVMLLIPSYIITKISPAKAVKFE